VLSDGSAVETDAIVLAVGVLPNQELAADAGLAVDNGIVVDDRLLTADTHISAIGDCAAHPNPFGLGMVRLESVQNAIDQARCVAARLTGTDEPYASLPWFWSNQGTARLQIAGLAAGVDQAVTRGDPSEGKFSEFLYRGGRLVCVESVSAPADHMAARRILAGGVTVPPEQASDPATNLKDFMPR
jgi:3-phenylpropionate/trans-cinnamate dioxygenase ferredoxin reductase component